MPIKGFGFSLLVKLSVPSFIILGGGGQRREGKTPEQVELLLLFFVVKKGIMHSAPSAEFTNTMFLFFTGNKTNNLNHSVLPFQLRVIVVVPFS